MTGLEKILEQIQTDANETAQSHLAEADKKAEGIIQETKLELEKEALKNEEVLNETKTAAIARGVSSAELETRKTILETKQMLIEKALNKAKESLENLEDSKYLEILLKLAKKYDGDRKLEMCLNSKDLAKVTDDFKAKLPLNITVSSDIVNIKSGFVLIGEGIDENCSFDALFADKIEQLQDTASSILF